MSTRHAVALGIVSTSETDLSLISNALQLSVNECEVLNEDPSKDAAVMLIATHLTFVTGCERHLRGSITKLYAACEREVHKDVAAIPPPDQQH